MQKSFAFFTILGKTLAIHSFIVTKTIVLLGLILKSSTTTLTIFEAKVIVQAENQSLLLVVE